MQKKIQRYIIQAIMDWNHMVEDILVWLDKSDLMAKMYNFSVREAIYPLITKWIIKVDKIKKKNYYTLLKKVEAVDLWK